MQTQTQVYPEHIPPHRKQKKIEMSLCNSLLPDKLNTLTGYHGQTREKKCPSPFPCAQPCGFNCSFQQDWVQGYSLLLEGVTIQQNDLMKFKTAFSFTLDAIHTQTWPAINSPSNSEEAQQMTNAVPLRCWGWSQGSNGHQNLLLPTTGGHPGAHRMKSNPTFVQKNKNMTIQQARSVKQKLVLSSVSQLNYQQSLYMNHEGQVRALHQHPSTTCTWQTGTEGCISTAGTCTAVRGGGKSKENPSNRRQRSEHESKYQIKAVPYSEKPV